MKADISKTTTILIAVTVILAGLVVWWLSTPTPGSQYPAGEITTVISTSTTHYEIEAALPPQEAIGGEVVRSEIQSKANDFIADARERAPEVSDQRGSEVQFSFNATTDIFSDGQLISYRVDTTEYRGGANANSQTKTFVFNGEGQQLEPDDVIVSEYQMEFLSAVRDALYAELEIQPGEKNTPSSMIESIRLDDLSIYVTSEAVMIGFSQYEVAPGSAGIITVSVPRTPYLASGLGR